MKCLNRGEGMTDKQPEEIMVTNFTDGKELPKSYDYVMSRVKTLIEADRAERDDENQRLREGLSVVVKWMDWWLSENECGCDEYHVCGKPERQLELELMKKALTPTED